MKNPIRTTIITLLLLLIASVGYALDVRDFSYLHLSKDNGMDNHRVFSICETENGAIWWSTKSGVGRYNGTKHFMLSTIAVLSIALIRFSISLA